MLPLLRKLGTPNSLCGCRMRRSPSCTHNVVFPKWARKSFKGLHWSPPEPHGRCTVLCLLHFYGAVVSQKQKGDPCSPVPEGECQCMLSLKPWKGPSIGVGIQGRASGLRNHQAGEDLLDRVVIALTCMPSQAIWAESWSTDQEEGYRYQQGISSTQSALTANSATSHHQVCISSLRHRP